MPRKQPEKIALPLRDLRELFTAANVDPADVRTTVDPSTTDAFEDELYESGIDYLMSRLRGQRLPRHGQLILALPSGTVQPDLAGTTRRAIDHYCRHKILETKRTLNELLWTGLKALQVGVLFLAICLVLAAVIARSNAAPGSIGDVVTQGLTIVGW